MIKAALEALAALLGVFNRRHDAKNAGDVKDRAKAQQKVNQKSEIEKAVADGDDEEYRKQIG